MAKNTIVQRVEKQYVGEDCVQIMVPYERTLTIFNKADMTFHYNDYSKHWRNQYLDDFRRKQFPYYNIPYHRRRYGIFRNEITYVNQLFNYNEPYIKIVDGAIIETFAVKERDEALVVNKVLKPDGQEVNWLTRSEIDEMFRLSKEQGQVYYIGLTYNNFLDGMITEIEMLEMIKKNVLEKLSDYKVDSGDYNRDLIKYIEDCVKNSKLESLTNLPIGTIEPIVQIKLEGEKIAVKKINIKIIKPDLYEVVTFNIPITRYLLEQIKAMATSIKSAPEPKIPLHLNPGVFKEDILEAKTFVKRINERK